MRIAVTADVAGRALDVLVDCDEDAHTGDIEQALSSTLGVPVVLGAGRAADVLVQGRDFTAIEGDQNPAYLELHVVGGPDSGLILPLRPGRYEVGRGGRLAWNDPSLRHRQLLLDVDQEGVNIVDLAGKAMVDAEACPLGIPVPLGRGQLLQVGDSVLEVRQGRLVDAVVESAGPGWRRFLRPPRIQSQYDQSSIEFPTPPAAGAKRRLPIVATAVPAAVGMGMALVLRNPMYLAFALLGPVTVLAAYYSDRRGSTQTLRLALSDYDVARSRAQGLLVDAVAAEQQRLRDAQPDPAETLLTCVLPGRRLWERRRDDVDALRLRIGLGDLASTVVVAGGASEVAAEAHLVPQVVDLRGSPVVGIVGAQALTDGLLRWLIAQLVAHSAPRDLGLVFLTAAGGAEWSWLHWLPHCRPEHPDSCVALIGNDPQTVAARVGGLLALIRAREGSISTRTNQRAGHFRPVVVVMHGFRALRHLADVAEVIATGPAVGVYVICADVTELALPEQAAAVVQISQDRPAYGSVAVSGARTLEGVLVDRVSLSYVEQLSRGMSALKETNGAGPESLPDHARLLDLLHLESPTPEAIQARWNTQPASTTMVIGISHDGPLTLDLKTDGPHGLIAGMTGSGKTELLQTIIASLAVANRPEWLNFVLIDYKGDSAFKDCANLPHTVGKVNDLDPFLVERALTSLEAELDARKRVLAEAAVKDIEDYHDLLAREPNRAPLPRLVLVVDEFAELAKELPDFMEGLVSLAQQGRSLGVHLLLATQRPSGVVSPAIRANTNMRIALRVADAQDSHDVLNSPDAAAIPQRCPGRGFARLGAHELFAFQAGRIGGHHPMAAAANVPSPYVVPLAWKVLGYAIPQRGQAQVPGDVADTDLARLVLAVRLAAEDAPRPRKPWLEPLPTTLLWSHEAQPMVEGSVPALPFGLSDDPARQSQLIASFDLVRDGHLYVIGSAGSGRTQVLRALAGSIAALTSPADVHVYGLDCGVGALNALAALPHCGAVVARTEGERCLRLLGRLSAELDARQQRLTDGGYANISDQRRGCADPMPHLVFMLDRWESFVPTLGEMDGPTDIVLRLLREGASAGIHLIITGDRSLLTNARMSTMTDHKFTLRLAEKNDYMLVGLNSKKIPDKVPAGRCYGPGMLETQVFLLSQDASGPAQSEVVQQWGAAAARRTSGTDGPRPFRLDALPARITLAAARALARLNDDVLIVGVGGDELAALGPEVTRSTSFIVAGPGRSGRSSVLLGAVRGALCEGFRVVVVAPRPSPLRSLADCDGVLAVLTDDLTTEAVEAAAAVADGQRLLVVVDDAEILRDGPGSDFFLRLVRGMVPHAFLLVAGQADGVAAGLTGWQIEAKNARLGMLLSPQGITDGDLIGVRIPRQVIGARVQVGRGLLHLGDGVLVPVATVAPDLVA